MCHVTKDTIDSVLYTADARVAVLEKCSQVIEWLQRNAGAKEEEYADRFKEVTDFISQRKFSRDRNTKNDFMTDSDE